MSQPTPRIIRETDLLLEDIMTGIEIKPNPQNFRHFFAKIHGPSKTCYEGGVFNLELYLPADYPMMPPLAVFTTKIYHPNIDYLGRICLSTLKAEWAPALQIRTVLLSIQALLCSPNPDDPLNNEAANLWKQNEAQALKIAKEYTQKYAK